MRTHLCLGLLLWSGVASAAPAATKLTSEQRQQIAIDHVNKSVAEWVPGNQKLVVRPAQVASTGNPLNPITGDGPIVIYVKQALQKGGAITRALHKLSPYANRRFVVNVCENGDACTLATESLAPQAKLTRAVKSTVPVAAIVNDVVSSGKLKELVGLGAGGATAMVAHPAVGAGLLVAAGQTLVTAHNTQAQKRGVALQATLAWIDTTYKEQGAYPPLRQAYERYKSELQKASPGASPVDILEFANQLSINNR